VTFCSEQKVSALKTNTYFFKQAILKSIRKKYYVPILGNEKQIECNWFEKFQSLYEYTKNYRGYRNFDSNTIDTRLPLITKVPKVSFIKDS